MVRPSPKACVIGAGYGGLASARYLKDYGVDFMTMEFSNFTFPDSTPSYPSAPCFYKYLQNFTREFDLEKYIQFRSLVTSVKWADKQWEIAYTKTDTGAAETVNCDYVIVSIGHYNRPKVPKFEGQDSFRGNIIHTQKYKDPEVFRDRRVLLVGAGASGLDLATHLSNVTSRLVHSHHLRYNQPYFGENYVKKPDIKMFTSTGVIFQDDSYEEIEDVILATGYDFDFSFLDESCGLTVSSKYVLPVYQYMVNIRRPSMVILALPKPIITRALDVQAEYAAALIAGKFQLPSQGDMLKSWLKHVYELQSKGKKIVDVNFLDNLQEAGITRVAPVLTDIRDFNAVNRLEDLLNYRDYDYELLDAHSYKRFYNPRNETCDIKVHIVNISIVTGTYPDKLKPVIVNPLYKKGDDTCISNHKPIAVSSIYSKIVELVMHKSLYTYLNHRPIAVSSIYSKIVELIMHKLLYTYLEKHKLFAPEQKGFRKGKTINMEVYELIHHIMESIDKHTKERYSVTCDFVVVAIGHYNQPKIPIFKGQEIFEDLVLRVIDTKGSNRAPFGLIVSLSKQPKFGLNYVKKPDVEMFLKNGVVFKDGCYEEVDDVILCTGYEFNLSFLDKSCELNATTRHVVPVYQHMAEYAVALIAGKFQLPSLADMMQSWLKHVTALYAEGRKIDDANLLFDDMEVFRPQSSFLMQLTEINRT
ncbi:hypothetical protein MSG28_006975 [Choristoneura fumiferana]|uniref:Uncharacterized protein n=1 Tax=Choristoneura fumiferana TaxID=7141 RepID=A0ACC0JM36_CHOFU|nr:hypothetical protein MSG28_006975 [Choristoneura fumiferana]